MLTCSFENKAVLSLSRSTNYTSQRKSLHVFVEHLSRLTLFRSKIVVLIDWNWHHLEASDVFACTVQEKRLINTVPSALRTLDLDGPCLSALRCVPTARH